MLGALLKRLLAGDTQRHAAGGAGANPLERYFASHAGERQMVKWFHYLEIYHRHFARFRGKSPVVLEIGVFGGGSLQMWSEYFGPGATIIGIDIDPACARFRGPGIEVLIGDQADRAFLAEVRGKVPRLDIVVDDGGHTMLGQIASFEELYPHQQPDGVYLCEDVHTSLYAEYGATEGATTFLEYAKGLVDRLHAWHSRDPSRLAVDAITRTTHSCHFYNSVFVAEKRAMQPPQLAAT